MWHGILKKIRYTAAAVLMGFLGLSGTAMAAEYWLRAEATTLTMPDGAVVTMWGYALDADNDFTTVDGTVQVPGPQLTVPPGEMLTIHLKNNLPEPTSIVIPGQIADSMNPVRIFPGQLTGRIRSFTDEAAANGGQQTYYWTNVSFKSGTFLYQSGTHPAIQVPMGLYGAVKADAAAGEAYPGLVYDSEVTLLFSEIDPDQHAAIDALYNGDPAAAYGSEAYPGTLVVGYHPKYFLVNGVPFSVASPPPPSHVTGTVLVRFLNAGSRGRMPVVQDSFFRVVAEDGNLKSFQPQQYSIDLQPGMTIDAILQATAPKPTAIFDRSLGLTNAGASPGGMYAFLETGAAVTQPNGGEVLTAGTFYTIGWSAVTGAASYRVVYSLDNGGSWRLIDTVGAETTLEWRIPKTAASPSCLIRVVAFDGSGTRINADQSDAPFTIAASPFAVVSPNGGETLGSGTLHVITWTAAPDAANYRLHYSLNGGATWSLIQKVGSVTTFNWTLPTVSGIQAASLVRVSALDASGRFLIQDSSDAVFTIQP